MQKSWDIKRLVFIDETGLNTKMTRLYGRAAKGERCLGSAPHGHWKSFTFIAALRHDRISAPWLLDGPMDKESFCAYVEHVLAPELEPGDLVICDNLASHKAQDAAKAIEARGARLLPLPAYSPDLNPIEMVFAKLKEFLRSQAARDWDALVEALKVALETFSPDQCLNFCLHASYGTN